MEPPEVALDVPELVLLRARAHGQAGRRWLDTLPGVVADLARRWDLDIGLPFRGGTASYVVAATERSGAGRACVLKVAMVLGQDDEDAFTRSVTVHRLAGGRGCVELLGHDPDARALLVERLGPNLADLGMPVPRLLETVAATLRSFWRPVDEGCGLPTGPEKAAWLATFITAMWEELDRPCPREVVDRAVACCDERAAAFDPSSAVLVHGDAHGWNTLAPFAAAPAGREDATAGAYKFVDPEGLRSDPAHDLAVPMREYNEPLLAGPTSRLVRERAELLGSLCDVDPEAIWQWGFVERVSTGLAGLRELDPVEAQAFLEVAERSR